MSEEERRGRVIVHESKVRCDLFLVEITNERHTVWSIYPDNAIGFLDRDKAQVQIKDLYEWHTR